MEPHNMREPEREAPTLSAVMPVFNEVDGIKEAVEELRQAVLGLVPDSEFVVVDDGSTDGTGDVLKEFDDRGEITLISQTNKGHGGALANGLNAARGQFLFLLDSDRQIPLEAFGLLWQVRSGRDAILGVRQKRQDPRHRLILTRFVRFFLNTLFAVNLRDANAPFKMVKREVWTSASRGLDPEPLVPSLLLASYAARYCQISEVGVPHAPRLTGEVTLRKIKLIKFCLKAILESIVFRVKMSPPK